VRIQFIYAYLDAFAARLSVDLRFSQTVTNLSNQAFEIHNGAVLRIALCTRRIVARLATIARRQSSSTEQAYSVGRSEDESACI
jgi:hypothetical protein